jgi:hypothetical protein
MKTLITDLPNAAFSELHACDLEEVRCIKERNLPFWFYNNDGEAFKSTFISLGSNAVTGKNNKNNKEESFDLSAIDVIPKGEDFENFKASLLVFDCYDENGEINQDPEFKKVFEAIYGESFDEVEDYFEIGDVFITDPYERGMSLTYSHESKDFFLIHLNEQYAFLSLDLALKRSYEFNK